jgi:hypothetical protein
MGHLANGADGIGLLIRIAPTNVSSHLHISAACMSDGYTPSSVLVPTKQGVQDELLAFLFMLSLRRLLLVADTRIRRVRFYKFNTNSCLQD